MDISYLVDIELEDVAPNFFPIGRITSLQTNGYGVLTSICGVWPQIIFY